MKQANFPSRIKARRVGALERLNTNKPRVQREGEEDTSYKKYLENRNYQIKVLRDRTK